MALLLTLATGAWAQDPDPIDLTPSADGTVWTLSTMPEYDVELEVTYYTDEEIAAMEKIGYYLVGNMNGWTPDSKYKLTENPNAVGEYMITLLLEPTSQFKIVYSEDGATAKYWYPSDGPNYGENGEIANDDRYTVYFKPGTGGGDWYYNCIYVASDPLFATPTGTRNEWVLDVPDYDVELEVEYETDLALNEVDDNTEKLTEWNGYEADVTLTRTLQAGGWNTFAVPFGLDIPAGWTVKKLTETAYDEGTKALTLTFGDATSIEAGKPYLVKVGAKVENPTFSNVEVKNTTVEAGTVTCDHASFVPVMSPTFLNGGDESVLFVTDGNTLTYPAGDGNINGFRAYFKLADGITGARAFRMSFGEETGITSIGQLDNLQSDDWYDLSGRKIVNGQSSNRQMNKGVYIVNGKKVIIN